MARFTIPRDIYFGPNAIENLKNIDGTKAVIVYGSERSVKDGTIPNIEKYLKEAGIESVRFGGVEPDPTVDTVMRGAQAMRDHKPDVIVAFGGGSPIDAAKAMWIFYEYPDSIFTEVAKPFNLPKLRQKARFVAIASTSGTGTEVTAFSVITDGKTKVKYPIADYNITPDVAIVDTDLVNSMPPVLTAHTGIDALTHSLEAYVSTVANPMTDSLAMKSIEMIFDELPKSFKGDKDARATMHLAQCMAGMSFTNALLGITHSMAHKTGKVFNIPHGCANAIYLPYVMQYNAKDGRGAKRYAEIAHYLGLKGTTEELVQGLIAKVQQLIATVDVPNTLKAYGVDEELFLSNLTHISDGAIQDACTPSNPREIDVPTMEKLFKVTYYGGKVDF